MIIITERSPLTYGTIRKEMNIKEWEAVASHIFFKETMRIGNVSIRIEYEIYTC
jgi:hypothetical protein